MYLVKPGQYELKLEQVDENHSPLPRSTPNSCTKIFPFNTVFPFGKVIIGISVLVVVGIVPVAVFGN